MITSHGDTWHPDAGASGFYRRDYGMPLDHFAITMQVFTGCWTNTVNRPNLRIAKVAFTSYLINVLMFAEQEVQGAMVKFFKEGLNSLACPFPGTFSSCIPIERMPRS